MVRIILIRHGETQWNIEGRYQGQEDTHLSERGLRQGHMVAEGLKDTPIDVAISSPLERSYMTCSFCADLHGLPVLVKGHMVADVVTLIGTIDIVLGCVDR